MALTTKAAPAAQAVATQKVSVAVELRGLSQLIIDGVSGVTDIVEDMHRTIAGLSPIIAQPSINVLNTGRTRGITGFVYRQVRGVTRLVGGGIDVALAQCAPLIDRMSSFSGREAVIAATNGVLGDYLEATGNPLAISMRLRQNGRPLEHGAPLGKRVLLLIHGLCLNDVQWQRNGHDHGAALGQELGLTPVYLHYNTGLNIDRNGQLLAALLDNWMRAQLKPPSELHIVAHSMGGLVARSAVGHALRAQQPWLNTLKKLVFLGTPHHGASLERAGNWVDETLNLSPYTQPLARLGLLRSAGIKDLRHGHIGGPGPAPLSSDIQWFALAASKQKEFSEASVGDGLVAINSALGIHPDPARSLNIPAVRRDIHYGLNHFDLLSSPAVYAQLKTWLGKAPRTRPKRLK